MKYKVVCSDIDGTLLNKDRELSQKTISVFTRLPTEVLVVLASSRMPAAMRHLQGQLGVLHHPLIAYNGGYVISYERDASVPVVYSDIQIPLTVVEGIINLATGTAVHISLYNADQWFVPALDYWAKREASVTKVDPLIGRADEVIARWDSEGKGAHKVMCMGPEVEINTMENLLNKEFGKDIHIYRSRPTYLELAPASISKGSALEKLLIEKFSISIEHAISFGDNYNDIDLLKVSGHGVAVSNSREEVRAVANEITSESHEDGVALTLEKYFLQAF